MNNMTIHTLEGLPIEEQTPELCMEMVSQCGTELKFIAKQTKKICLAAMTNDSSAMQYIDPNIIDRDLMKAAILFTSELGTDTDYIIDVKRRRGDNWTFCICEEGKAQITDARRKAAQAFTGEELNELYGPLLMADDTGSVMEDLLRAGIITDHLTDLMAKMYPTKLLRLITGYGIDDLMPYQMSFELSSIPSGTRSKILTQKLCDAAFAESINRNLTVVLGLIPEKFRTRDMCLRAVKKDASTYRFFSQSVMDDELWEIVLKKAPEIITTIRQPSVGLRRLAIQRDPELIANIAQTDELCLLAVQTNPKVFQLCRRQTDELVKAAIDGDIQNVKWLTTSTINHIAEINIRFKAEPETAP